MSDLATNEIHDYLARAPKKWEFRGREMINNTHVRLVWLAGIARGPINERINRRAVITDPWRPFCDPTTSAIRRNDRNKLRRAGIRRMTHTV